MSNSRKIIYNVITSSTSKVLGTFLALVNIGLITRYLGQDDFGLYITALAFFIFFNSLGDWGLYQTTVKKISRPRANEKEILSNIIGLRLIISALIVFLTPFITKFLPYPEKLKQGIFIIALAFFFSSSQQLLIGLFQKRLKMDQIAVIEFFGKIIQLSVVFIGIKMELGLTFILSSLLATMFFNFVATLFLTRKFISFSPRIDLLYWKKFMKESWPLGLSVLVTFAYFKADSILLSFYKPAEDVGIYGAAYKIIENLSFFPGMVVGLTMPMFAYSIFNKKEKFVRLANTNFKVFLILVFPLITGTMFLADEIILLIAGEGFSESAIVLRIVIFAMGLIFFGQLFNNILIAANLQKYLFWALFICAVFSVSLNLMLIPHYSYLATSFISVATEALVVILGFLIIKKKLNYTPKITNLTGIIASTALMSGFLFLASEWNLFIRILLSPLVYFTGLILFKAIEKEEVLDLFKRKNHSEEVENPNVPL